MLEFLIYLLAFIIGSIIGLLYSYKQHGEPFIVKGLNVVMCVVSVIGWMLAVNCQFSQGLIAANNGSSVAADKTALTQLSLP